MSDKTMSDAAGGTTSPASAPLYGGQTEADIGSTSATAAGTARTHDEGGAKTRLKSQADELMHAAKQRAKDIASEQKDAAAAQLGSMARGLRDAAASMQGESEFAGRYAGKAAESLERFSQDLRGADFDQLVERTENYARRNPAVFLGGAVAAGFLFARFLKSSRDRSRYRGHAEAYRARTEPPQGAAATGI